MRMTAVRGLVLGLFGAVALATTPPGREPLERTCAYASHAFAGRLISRVASETGGGRSLAVVIAPERAIWGALPSGPLKASYREFVPLIPEGVGVCCADFTGSGIEFTAEPGRRYVFLLMEGTEGFALLRLEPAEREKEVGELHMKSQVPAAE